MWTAPTPLGPDEASVGRSANSTNISLRCARLSAARVQLARGAHRRFPLPVYAGHGTHQGDRTHARPCAERPGASDVWAALDIVKNVPVCSRLCADLTPDRNVSGMSWLEHEGDIWVCPAHRMKEQEKSHRIMIPAIREITGERPRTQRTGRSYFPATAASGPSAVSRKPSERLTRRLPNDAKPMVVSRYQDGNFRTCGEPQGR
jgi:hypothetical protein